MPKTAQDTEIQERLDAWTGLWRESCIDFIEDAVYFIDKENPDGQIQKFKMWDKQKEALDLFLRASRAIALKSRQLGVTWLALAYITWRIVFFPGQDWFALSKTEDPDAYQLVARVVFILERLPSWLIQYGKNKGKMLTWESTASKVTIHHPDTKDANGKIIIQKPSVFQSFAATADAARSWTGDGLLLDESAAQEYAREVWTAAQPTIGRPTSGQVIVISTNRRGTWFEETAQKAYAGKGKFKFIFFPWNTDPRRNEKWYQETLEELGNELAMRQEHPATPEEAFELAGGKFFPELRGDVHIKMPGYVNPNWRRYRSIDYGRDMLACYWYWVDYQGYARIYRELYRPGLIVSEAAEAIKAADDGDVITSTFAPDDLWDIQTSVGKNEAQLFAENGVYLTKTSRKRVAGWSNVKEWLKVHIIMDGAGKEELTAKLTIDKDAAPNLWRSLLAIQCDPKNPQDAAEQPHEITHACVTGDTVVHTTTGNVPIRDLVGKEGYLFCFDQQKQQKTTGRYFNVILTRENAEVYAVELEDKTIIKATADHLFLTQRGWVKTIDLTPKDSIKNALNE